MADKYYIGMKFVNTYPEDAADWVAENDAYIKQTSEDGVLPLTYEIRPQSEIKPNIEILFRILRFERNKRLAATDFYLMPDYIVDEIDKQKILEYRQALRDMPQEDDAPWDGGGEKTPWPVLNI